CRPNAIEKRADGGIGGGAARLEIVLEIAGGTDVLRRRTDVYECFADRLALGEDDVGMIEHMPKEPGEAQIPRRGPIGDAAVDDDQAGADALRLAEQGWPDFRFGYHDHRGAQPPQDAADGEDVIDGSIKYAGGELGQLFVGRGFAGERRG